MVDDDFDSASDLVRIDIGGSNIGTVRFGTLADARVEFLPVGALEGSAVYTAATGDGDLLASGALAIPTTDLVGSNPFVADQWYLLQVTGGEAVDIDDDGIADGARTPMLGTGHALLTGEQIVSEDFRVTAMTDLAYQRAASRVAANAEPGAILASLNQTAAMQLDVDVSNDGSIDHRDIALWDPVAAPDALRRPSAFSSAKSLILGGGLPTEIADLGSAVLGGFSSGMSSGTAGLIRRPGTAIVYLAGLDSSDSYSLSAVDVSDIDNPEPLGRVDLTTTLSYSARSVADYVAVGETVYLMSFDRLIAVDFADPSLPTVADTIDRTSLGGSSLTVERGVAFLAGSTGVEVYDVSDAANLQLLDVLPSAASSVASDANRLAVGRFEEVSVYDIGNPETPVLADTLNLGQSVGALTIAGDTALVFSADADVGNIDLSSIDVGNPASLAELDRIRVAALRSPGISPPLLTSLSVVGQRLYASGANNANYVVDFANASSLVNAGFIPDPASPLFTSNAERGEVIDDRWFLGTIDGYLVLDLVYDRPVLQDGLADVNGGTLVAGDGDLAFVLAASQLEIHRTDADGGLQHLATVSGLLGTTALAVELPYAYLSSAERTVIVDVTNPSAPTLAGEFVDPAAPDSATSTCVNNRIVYKATFAQGELQVIDASDPANPARTATIPLQNAPSAVANDCSDMLFVASNGGYEAFDIAGNPLAPASMGNNALQTNSIAVLAVQGSTLIAAGSDTVVARLTDTGSVADSEIVNVGAIRNIAVDDRFVYASSFDYGMVALSVDDAGSVAVEFAIPDFRSNALGVTDHAVVIAGERLVSFRKPSQRTP